MNPLLLIQVAIASPEILADGHVLFDLPDLLSRTEVVFVGEVGSISSRDPTYNRRIYTFSVHEVMNGSALTDEFILGQGDFITEASLKVEPGQTLLILESKVDPTLSSTTTPVRNLLIPPIRKHRTESGFIGVLSVEAGLIPLTDDCTDDEIKLMPETTGSTAPRYVETTDTSTISGACSWDELLKTFRNNL